MAFVNPSEIGQPPKVSPDDHIMIAHGLYAVSGATTSSAEIARTASCAREVASRSLAESLVPQGLAVKVSAHGRHVPAYYSSTERLGFYIRAVNEATAMALTARGIGNSADEVIGRAALVFAMSEDVPATRDDTIRDIGLVFDPPVPPETVIWRGLRGIMGVNGILRLHELGLKVNPTSLD